MPKIFKAEIEDVILYLNSQVQKGRRIQFDDLYGSELSFEVLDDKLGTVAHVSVLEREEK